MADCHVGGWSEPRLKELTIKSFASAIDVCIKENVAFVLIAGDLFNTAIPSLDLIKEVAHHLSKLKERDISVYVIPGSHDYSPSGKTMLDVFEKAGLLENVVKIKHESQDKIVLEFTHDKTNTKITGLYGKRNSLDKEIYKILDKQSLEEEKGFKIFMFHCAISQYKPQSFNALHSQDVWDLPKNFNYYAGGHVHYVFNTKVNNGLLAFPGPLFPNNFQELKELEHGGFYIVNVNSDIELKYVPIQLHKTQYLDIDVDGLSSIDANDKIIDSISKIDQLDKIILLRIKGVLESGKISDIDFKKIEQNLLGAYVILRNTSGLTKKEYQQIQVSAATIEALEQNIIDQKSKEIKSNLGVNDLMLCLNLEKDESERNQDFEERLLKNLIKTLDLQEIWN